MGNLFALASSPILICGIYIYIRDKYEKEPLRLLIIGLIYGFLIAFPITKCEILMSIFTPNSGFFVEALYNSFMVAAFVEEGFKFVILFFLVWRNDNFNERFDGIVYAVFISLGFAFIENILYVMSPSLGGLKTAIYRGIFSVPGHAFFGVCMGYYFALSKYTAKKKLYFLKSFFIPWFLHGIYDLILSFNNPYYMLIFIPFVIILWINGFRQIKIHIDKSPFRY